MDKLIYSKTYPKDSWKDMLNVELPELPDISFEEFLGRLKSNVTLREIPGRRQKQKRFIEAAKALSKEFEYDIQIWQTKYGILVELYLDIVQQTNGKLSRLIGMSDSFGIATGERNRDVTISLKCSSFYVSYKGRVILPELFAE